MLEKFIQCGIIISGDGEVITEANDKKKIFYLTDINSHDKFESLLQDVKFRNESETIGLNLKSSVLSIATENICTDMSEYDNEMTVNNLYPPGFFEPKFNCAQQFVDFFGEKTFQPVQKGGFIKTLVKRTLSKSSLASSPSTLECPLSPTTICGKSLIESNRSVLSKKTMIRKNFNKISLDFINTCNGIRKLLHPREIKIHPITRNKRNKVQIETEHRIILLPLTNINGDRSYALGMTFLIPFIIQERGQKEFSLGLVEHSLVLISKYPCQNLTTKLFQHIFRDKYTKNYLIISRMELRKRFHFLTALLTRLPIKNHECISDIPDLQWSINETTPFLLPCGNPSYYNHGDIDFTLVRKLITGKILEKVVIFLLLEKRVIFQCSDQEIITIIMESLLRLIRPFQWNFTYFPCMPLNMIDLLESPSPYMIGFDVGKNDRSLDEVYFDYCTLIVDLDTSECCVKRRNDFEKLSDIEFSLREDFSACFDQFARKNLIKRFQLDKSVRPKPISYSEYLMDCEENFKRENEQVEDAFKEFINRILEPLRDFYKQLEKDDTRTIQDFNELFLTMNYLKKVEFYTEFLKTDFFYNFYERDLIQELACQTDNETIQLCYQGSLDASFYSRENNFFSYLRDSLDSIDNNEVLKSLILAFYIEETFCLSDKDNSQVLVQIYRGILENLNPKSNSAKGVAKILKEVIRKEEIDLIDKFDDFEFKCQSGEIDVALRKDFINIFISYCVINDYSLLENLYSAYEKSQVKTDCDLVVGVAEKFIDCLLQIRDLNAVLRLKNFLGQSTVSENEVILYISKDAVQIGPLFQAHIGLTQYQVFFITKVATFKISPILFTEISEISFEDGTIIIDAKNQNFRSLKIASTTDSEDQLFLYTCLQSLSDISLRISQIKDYSHCWNYLLEVYILIEVLYKNESHILKELLTLIGKSLASVDETNSILHLYTPMNHVQLSFLNTLNFIRNNKENVLFMDYHIGDHHLEIINAHFDQERNIVWLFLNATLFNNLFQEEKVIGWMVYMPIDNSNVGDMRKNLTLPTTISCAEIIEYNDAKKMIWIGGTDEIVYIFDNLGILVDSVALPSLLDDSVKSFVKETIVHILQENLLVILITSWNRVFLYHLEYDQIKFVYKSDLTEPCRFAHLLNINSSLNLLIVTETSMSILINIEYNRGKDTPLGEITKCFEEYLPPGGSISTTSLVSVDKESGSFELILALDQSMILYLFTINLMNQGELIEKVKLFSLTDFSHVSTHVTSLLMWNEENFLIGLNNGLVGTLTLPVHGIEKTDNIVPSYRRVHRDSIRKIGKITHGNLAFSFSSSKESNLCVWKP